MNRYLALFVCASLASNCALTATAANRNNPLPGSDPGTPARATALIGAKVENRNAEKIGTVSDLAVDLASGRIVHVIVSSGGFLSLGARTLAIPPDALRFDAETTTAHTDLTQNLLKNAPDIEIAQWREFYDSDRPQEADRYHGREPHRGAARPANVRQASKLMKLPVLNRQDENIGSVEDIIVELRSGRVVAAIVSSGGFLGMGDSLNAIPPAALQFATAHDGLRLDMDKAALLAAPRFKSDEWPDFAQRNYTDGVYRAYNQEPYARDENRLAVQADNAARNVRDRAERRPLDDADNASRNVRDRDERRPLVDADNAARNVRDRTRRTLTAGDQSDRASDVKITQLIRQAVVGADGLSINAQNVKIITVDGRVTLRGPVASSAEKIRIGELAALTVPRGQVDNQLEVTTR